MIRNFFIFGAILSLNSLWAVPTEELDPQKNASTKTHQRHFFSLGRRSL